MMLNNQKTERPCQHKVNMNVLCIIVSIIVSFNKKEAN